VPLVAIARVPVGDVAAVDLGSGSQSEAIALNLALDGEEVRVLAVRTRSPRGPARWEVRGRELAAVGEWAAAEPDLAIVLGDLNATPWTADFRDLVDRADLRNSQLGFGVQGSWPTWFPPAMIPIDHALHTEGLSVIDRSLGEHHGSPHRALRVEYALEGGTR
jgi:endonuclease/exonuclease/phosphatase (EEP) superfamily protein YafD